jgi:hypothetical protein
MSRSLFPFLVFLAAAAALPVAAQTSRPVPELGTAPIPRQLPTLPTPGQPPSASDEVKDPKTGCGAVMMNAEPSIGITWSGACDYGLAQGKGVLQWTKNGAPTDRYEGEMKEGLYEGQGKLTYANKARYEGEFKAGERDGKGTFVFPSGARLTAEFREGRPQGHGMYVWTNGNRYIGDFRDNQRTGRGTMLFADGGRYEGEFVNGKMQGRGVRVWANGARYEGEWMDDRANGWGTKSGGPGGQIFTGIWTNGCFRENQRWATVGATAQACGFQ